MILIAAALAAAAPSTASPAKPADSCPSVMTVDAWSCRALVASKAGRFADSAAAFESAAQLSPQSDPARGRALAAAGNMWIAANQPGKAALALDKALAGGGLRAEQHGLALLDRARAALDQNDLKTARAKVTEAAKTIAEDPYLWFFSAGLALREQDLPTAKAAINRALSMAKDSPEVLFEAGRVADAAGENGAARDYWQKALAADPNGPAGKAAREALAMAEVPLTVTGNVAKLPNGDGEGSDKH